MSKHEIEIQELPEGWKPVALRPAIKCKDWVLLGLHNGLSQVFLCDWDDNNFYVIVEKIQPRRIVLEETDELASTEKQGYVLLDGITIEYKRSGDTISPKHKIWKQVRETDLSLTKDDDKLSLSVNELKQLDLYGMTDHAVTDKIRAFIKGK